MPVLIQRFKAWHESKLIKHLINNGFPVENINRDKKTVNVGFYSLLYDLSSAMDQYRLSMLQRYHKYKVLEVRITFTFNLFDTNNPPHIL